MSTNTLKQNPFEKNFAEIAERLRVVENLKNEMLQHANENQKGGRSQ